MTRERNEMDKTMAVVLGAGKGTRMGAGEGSGMPKVMFLADGKPLIGHAVDNLRQAGIEKIAVVVGYKKEMVQDYLDGEVDYAIQDEQLGTGHAVAVAKNLVQGQSEAVLVCYGDMPLFKIETIKKLIEEFQAAKPTIAMLSVEFEDPQSWAYGRIERDEKGDVKDIVEQKDCNEEQLKIKESNPGFYIFQSVWLWENISKLKSENAQREYYLTDLIGLATKQGKRIIAQKVSEENEALGVNTPEQLKQAEEILAARAK